MRVVQVSVSWAEFADTLGVMRDWLDGNNRPLVRFETTTKGEIIVLTVQFDDDELGDAFGQAFGGSEAT
jgi:hypothetical protein